MVMLSGLALCACEDGPNQTYKPPPSGAADAWGIQPSDGFAEAVNKDFAPVSGSKNAQEICTPIEKHAKWAKMVKEPITPSSVGGINILGGTPDKPTFAGLTVDKAEETLCQSTAIGAEYTDNNPFNAWGDNYEVTLGYLASNRRAYIIEVHAGYKGIMTFHSRDKKDEFIFSADNQQIQKNGKGYELHWKTSGTASDVGSINYEINELYDAMASEFTALPKEADCLATRHCRIADFNDGGAYLSFGTMGVSIRVRTTIADIKTGSTPERIRVAPVKIMGYSFADVMLKLDESGEGPVATDNNALGSGKHCSVRMGLQFHDFRDNCVTVFGASEMLSDGKTTKNSIELAKLFGGIGHNDERFNFAIAGLNTDFTDKTLSQDDIIRDQDRPTDDDIATTFVVTGSTFGKISNDYPDFDTSKIPDYHSLGLIQLEWANLAQNILQDLKYSDPKDVNRKVIGDPRCLVADPSTVDGCTGLEGIVTTASPSVVPAGSPMLANALGTKVLNADGSVTKQFSVMALSMKPGTWRSLFCSDANAAGDPTTGYKKCAGRTGFDSFFKTAYEQVKKVYGKGVETNLPPDVRDVRFLFKQFVFAMLKYLQVASPTNTSPTLAQVDAGIIDPDNLFFDSIGSGQYEFAEYVDRHLVNSKGQDPTDLLISADTLNGIMSSYEFSQDLYRGETAVYDALIIDRQNNRPGAENTALLMNIVGNPIVASNYHDVEGAWSGYKCATQNLGDHDADCCDKLCKADPRTFPPQEVFTDAVGNVILDEDKNPILTKYPGAFVGKQTPFAIGLPTSVKILDTHPFIRAAKVSVPIHADPFNPASQELAPHETLVPWIPKGNGAGFYIAVNGSQDRFVNTHELDFSGTTVSLNMNFLYPNDPVTHLDDYTKVPTVAATETTDFLGEYWMCQARNGEVLRVRMYTSAQTILDWFTSHPNSVGDCDVVFRYGPFGNYLDYITARATGVRLGINPGAGSGRVIDIVVYDPSLN
jgi:hypothetical protein